jgi:hypothetical protein
MNKLSLVSLVLVALLVACREWKIVTVPNPSETHHDIAKPPLELIDISKMPPLGPKRMQTSMEDALGNKNQVLEDLIANGKDSIPFLINQLDDETEMNRHAMPFWYQLYVGDMSLIILSELFTDETKMKSTIPGFWWDDFLERGNDKDLMGEEVLRRYIKRHGRKIVQQRWQKMWNENKDNIFWDKPCRCFKLKS